jgi:Alanine dehydrogenase/PNT, C-terminal domain
MSLRTQDSRARTVIVDIAIDQGGCAETSRTTTHSHPTFVVDNVVHYCVTNRPGAVPAHFDLCPDQCNNSFILALADNGLRRALHDDLDLRNGLNVHNGQITCRAVADALKLPYTPADQALHVSTNKVIEERQFSAAAQHVCLWHLADIDLVRSHVRFWGQTRRGGFMSTRPSQPPG